MSSISALLNVASASHSTNEHDLPSLASLSTALLHSYPPGSSYHNSARYSLTPPSYSPPHSRESNSPSTSSQNSFPCGPSYSSTSSYLPTPASSVRNLPLTYSSSSANVSPSYTSGDSSFAYPSPRSETATIGPSYLSQSTPSSAVESSYSFPYSMSRASTHAPMMSQPPSPALPVSAPLQQPTPPQHQQTWSSMPPPPPPAQADDKDQSKVRWTRLPSHSCSNSMNRTIYTRPPHPPADLPPLLLPKRPRRSTFARRAPGHSPRAATSRGILGMLWPLTPFNLLY